MSEFERRLRKLAEVPDGPLLGHDLERYEFALAAARIGAEVERDQCITVVATSGDQFASILAQAEVQKRIRARGDE
jgi:hypothetical protein